MRDWLTISCFAILCFGMIGSLWFYQYPHSVVYSCSDKANNPTDVQKLCERLTRGQWWSK
jgi:hypothetical protein